MSVYSANITALGRPVAGSTYTLMCTAMVWGNTSIILPVTWMNSNGAVPIGPTISIRNGSITFSPLLTTNSGKYSCGFTLALTPGCAKYISLVVQSKHICTCTVTLCVHSLLYFFPVPPPAVLVTTIPTVGPFYAGTKALITCCIQIDKAVDIPVVVDTVWIGPQGPVHNDSRSTISASHSAMSYNTTLQINPLGISDRFLFQCIWNVSSGNPYILPNINFSQYPFVIEGTGAHHSRCI